MDPALFKAMGQGGTSSVSSRIVLDKGKSFARGQKRQSVGFRSVRCKSYNRTHEMLISADLHRRAASALPRWVAHSQCPPLGFHPCGDFFSITMRPLPRCLCNELGMSADIDQEMYETVALSTASPTFGSPRAMKVI